VKYNEQADKPLDANAYKKADTFTKVWGVILHAFFKIYTLQYDAHRITMIKTIIEKGDWTWIKRS